MIVARPGVAVDLEAIVAHCTGRLAKYKIPAAVSVVAELPRTVTGKVQKGELRRRYGGR